jgi:hypothetical protein
MVGLKKVLVVYDNAGAGHRAMADILAEIAGALPDVQVVLRAGSELVPGALWIVALWDFLIRHDLVRLADWLVNYFIRAILVPLAEVLETGRFFKALNEIAPAMIVCTADGYNKALGEYARVHRIPFIISQTDMTVFADMVHPDAVHLCYFQESVDAIRALSFDATYFATPVRPETTRWARLAYVVHAWRDVLLPWRSHRHLLQLGAALPQRNHARCLALGPLRDARHHRPRNRSAVRAQLGMAPDDRCILIASGSLGGRFLRNAVRSIQKSGIDFTTTRLLVVTGHDTRSRAWLEARQARCPALRCQILPFVDNMPELLTACDVLIARPSCGVFLEAMLAQIPMILPDLVTVNDRSALTLLRRFGLGETFDSSQSLTDALERVLGKSAQYRLRMGERLGRARPVEEVRAEIGRLLSDELSRC